MSTQKLYSDSGLWWHWLIATAAGLSIGLLLLIPGLHAGFYAQIAFFPFLDLSGLVAMGLVGFFQALVIRPHLPTWKWWILATIVGWLAFLILSTYGDYVFPLNIVSRTGYEPFLGGNSITGIQLGSIVGVFQWIVLRGKVEDASWWIPISAIAYAFGLPTSTQVGLVNLFQSANYASSFTRRRCLDCLSWVASAVQTV